MLDYACRQGVRLSQTAEYERQAIGSIPAITAQH